VVRSPDDEEVRAGVDAQGAGKLQTRFRRVARPVAHRLWHFDLQGFDRLPAEGPAILCPNHISFLDSAFLMLNVGRNISFVGKAEYMDSWKTKHLFPALGMIPIDRAGGDKSQAALDTAERVLRRGELFGIFPEGTRSRDGYLYKGRTGAARLALKVGCPIFPVGVIGTREVQPPDAKLPKLRMPVTIKIGRPINVARYKSRGDDHLLLRQITDELMFEIRELTGQEYRNVYAGKTADTETPKIAKVAHVGDVPADERVPVLAGGGE
jgi:1-acyl-sn-glycerol-3-phosphate acyltransferase